MNHQQRFSEGLEGRSHCAAGRFGRSEGRGLRAIAAVGRVAIGAIGAETPQQLGQQRTLVLSAES